MDFFFAMLVYICQWVLLGDKDMNEKVNLLLKLKHRKNLCPFKYPEKRLTESCKNSGKRWMKFFV
jgi:hypothetical protein